MTTNPPTDRSPSLAELEIRSELFDAMDGNLRMSKRHKLLDAYRDAVLASAPTAEQPPVDRAAVRDRIVTAIKTAPFEELRTVGYAPNGPLQITIRVEELADAILRAVPAAVSVPPPTRADDRAAAECSAQNRNYESGPRLCIRAAQHHGDHIDERGFHWSDTTAVYPLADGTFRTGINVRAELRRMADEAQQQPDTETPTESVIYQVVGDWGDDSADSAAGARAAVAKWLRAYPKCGAYAQQRIVREWPDGSEFYGPWTDLPDAPAVPVQPAAADTREETETDAPGRDLLRDCECGGSTPHPDCPAHGDQRAVCVCGHTRAEHIRIGGPFGRGRLLCDACDPDSTNNPTCEEFEAL